MQGSVARGVWARFRMWALNCAVLAVTSAGCSDEPEVTTELPPGAPRALLGSGRSSSVSEPGSVSSSTGNRGSEAARPGGETPQAPAGSRPPGAAPSELGADPLLPLGADVPGGDYCFSVSEWDPDWVQFELEVLQLVNQARSQPADCGEEGAFAAAAPVAMDPVLRCSARLQSLDMFERAFFAHVNPDGLDPFERMRAAGFRGGGAGENIAVGQTSPEQVMQSWLDSDGHCANVMRPNYTLLGVGYHPGEGGRGLGSNFWTQNFGAPKHRR